jgi:oligoendopeptidase F
MDEMGALSYRVWYYASLHYDEDQRNNEINARRQQVQILFARQQQASSWFNPELLAIPLDTIARGWRRTRAGRLPLCHREPVPRAGARPGREGRALLSYSGRFNSVPYDSYSALTTADMKFPEITLSTGERVTLTYGQYRRLLETNRRQEDRAPRIARSTGLRRQPEHLRVALQRRAAARLVSTPARAATPARSTRRCTATTFRRPWSRT